MSIAKLNVQGLSRRDESLMRCIVATPGYTLISSDSRAAEPSVTAHYSKDPNYRLATFDMVGKKPYFRKDGLLIIDDIYLMVASRYPEWEPDIKEAFSTTYGGVSAGDKWVEDPDFIAKEVLKHIRSAAKPLCLARGTLIRVRNQGWKPIEDVTANDEVWDGEAWVRTDGAIYKGVSEVINVSGVYSTKDHKFLTHDGWREANYVRENKFEAIKAKKPSASWSDVWALGMFIGRSILRHVYVSYGVGVMRARNKICSLRQLNKR